MELSAYAERLRGGAAAKFPADANSLEFAQKLDSQDELSHLRYEFILPTKTSIKKTALDGNLPSKFTHADLDGFHSLPLPSSPCMTPVSLTHC